MNACVTTRRGADCDISGRVATTGRCDNNVAPTRHIIPARARLAFGFARLLGVIPVPAKITAKDDASWTWRVGPIELVHRVVPRERGCTVAIDLRAPGSLEPALAAIYGPVIQSMLDRDVSARQSIWFG